MNLGNIGPGAANAYVGETMMSDNERAERIAHHLKYAQTLREIAAVLSLRAARVTVLKAAAEYEQLATSLEQIEFKDIRQSPLWDNERARQLRTG